MQNPKIPVRHLPTLSVHLLMGYLEFLSCFKILAHIKSATLAESHLSHADVLTLRLARKSDLDDITTIGLEAFAKDVEQLYRFPYASSYPDERRKYARMRYSEYLDNNACKIMLVQAQSKEDPCIKRLIAFSIWQLPDAHIRNRSGGSEICSCTGNQSTTWQYRARC